MELAMKIISNDKTVRNDTVQDLKDFNLQSLTTQARKGEQLVSMMPAIKEAFNLMGDDIVELSVENESLKNQIGQYDEKWLQESKVKLLKEIDDEKKSKFIHVQKEKANGKTLNIFILVQLLLFKWLLLVIINCGNQNPITSFLKKINYKI